MNNSKKILICPVEWGLGHAGRMIPLALKLQKMNNEIIIGASREHLALFRIELQEAKYIEFPGFRPEYSRILPPYIAILLKTPILIYHIIIEHIKLKSIIRNYKIDIVISDNRFGLWSRKIKTVYITHLHLIPLPEKLKSLEWIGILIHRYIIKKYTYCFIPDLPGKINISGRLSHGLRLPDNTRYIGILSRFSLIDSVSANKEPEVPLISLILSGPEPQRGIFRQKVTDILKENDSTVIILEGKPGKSCEVTRSGNIYSYNHLPSSDFRKVILESDHIISRSGYSTIMELISLKRSALLVPTPGQTEQEYLAEYLSEKGWFSTVAQKNLRKGLLLPARKTFPGAELIIDESAKLLEKALNDLLNQ